MSDDPITRFAGHFLIYRKATRGFFRRIGRRADGAGRLPRFRHPTIESAEAEVVRLSGLHPGATFVIMREVGRVKLPAEAPAEEKEMLAA